MSNKAKTRGMLFYDVEWKFLRDYAKENQTTISAAILDALEKQYALFPRHERGKGGAPAGNQNWQGKEEERQ